MKKLLFTALSLFLFELPLHAAPFFELKFVPAPKADSTDKPMNWGRFVQWMHSEEGSKQVRALEASAQHQRLVIEWMDSNQDDLKKFRESQTAGLQIRELSKEESSLLLGKPSLPAAELSTLVMEFGVPMNFKDKDAIREFAEVYADFANSPDFKVLDAEPCLGQIAIQFDSTSKIGLELLDSLQDPAEKGKLQNVQLFSPTEAPRFISASNPLFYGLYIEFVIAPTAKPQTQRPGDSRLPPDQILANLVEGGIILEQKTDAAVYHFEQNVNNERIVIFRFELSDPRSADPLVELFTNFKANLPQGVEFRILDPKAVEELVDLKILPSKYTRSGHDRTVSIDLSNARSPGGLANYPSFSAFRWINGFLPTVFLQSQQVEGDGSKSSVLEHLYTLDRSQASFFVEPGKRIGDLTMSSLNLLRLLSGAPNNLCFKEVESINPPKASDSK